MSTKPIVQTIDHRNPPKPNNPAPEQKKAPDHFDNIRPDAIDHNAKPAALPATATTGKK